MYAGIGISVLWCLPWPVNENLVPSKRLIRVLPYILCYEHSILWIHHDPDDVLNKLNWHGPLKPHSFGSPDMYLGTQLKHMQLHNVVCSWSMSPSEYVQEAEKNYEMYDANTWVRVTDSWWRQIIHSNMASASFGCLTSIGTRWGILWPVLGRSNDMDD